MENVTTSKWKFEKCTVAILNTDKIYFIILLKGTGRYTIKESRDQFNKKI